MTDIELQIASLIVGMSNKDQMSVLKYADMLKTLYLAHQDKNKMGQIIEVIDWKKGKYRLVENTPPVELTDDEHAKSTEVPLEKKEPEKPETKKEMEIIEVMPWEPMPEGFSDYRPLLQRDGLFLYAWTIHEDGNIIVNWHTTFGKMRTYRSLPCDAKALVNIMPAKYGYHCRGNAWDYKKSPDCAVFAAPRYIDYYERAEFLVKLRESGVTSNFDHHFTLANQKNRVTKTETPYVVDRFIDMTRRIESNPDQAMNYIEYFISAIITDETVNRWHNSKVSR